MSRYTHSPTDPATEAEFEAALTELIRSADDNDVAVEGGWFVHMDSTERPDLGVEILPVV